MSYYVGNRYKDLKSRTQIFSVVPIFAQCCCVYRIPNCVQGTSLYILLLMATWGKVWGKVTETAKWGNIIDLLYFTVMTVLKNNFSILDLT